MRADPNAPWKAVEAFRSDVARLTGFPVELIEDNSLDDTTAASVPVWKDNGKSVVRYNSRGKAVIPHIVARELQSLRMEHKTRQAGKACGLRYVPDNPERTRIIAAHVRRLTRSAASGTARDFVTKVTDTLMPRLLLTPLDAVLEYGLWTRHASLRPSQTVGLYLHSRQKRNPLDQSKVSRALPLPVHRAHETAGAAWAIFIDNICGGRTTYAAEYARCPGLPLARELAETWQQAVVDFQPGDEYTLVQQFVQALRLDSWMEIKPSAQ